MSWVAIEDASSAFERPTWAVEKMVAEGKLERRVDADGRVFVRRPPTLDELANELAPLLPEEVVPVVMTEVEVEAVEGRIDDSASASAGRSGSALAAPSREELMLRALWQLLEKQQAQIAEIRDLAASAHVERARAERPAPHLPLARPRPSLAERRAPPSRRPPVPSAVALVVVFFAAFSLGAGWLATQSVEAERARSERALEHADWMARKLIEDRRGVAPVSTTLVAGFRR